MKGDHKEHRRLKKRPRKSSYKTKKSHKKAVPKKKKVILYLIYCLGILLFAYPFASNWYYERLQGQVSTDYDRQMATKSPQELSAIKQGMAARNHSLYDQEAQEVTRPIETKSYTKKEQVLLGDVLAVLEIPKLRMTLPVYEGTSDFQLQQGAGLLEGSSVPFGGENSHSVITGHRGLPSARLFTDLPKLALKDSFYLKITDEIHAYEVDQIKVVEPEDISDLKIVAGQDYVTLLTCTPYMLNTHRLLVRGHRIPYEAEKRATQTTLANHHYWQEVTLYAVIFLAILWWIMMRQYLKKRKEVKKIVA